MLVYQDKIDASKYVCRTILVYFELRTVSAVRSGPLWVFSHRDNFVLGQSDAGNNWGKEREWINFVAAV